MSEDGRGGDGWWSVLPRFGSSNASIEGVYYVAATIADSHTPICTKAVLTIQAGRRQNLRTALAHKAGLLSFNS